MPREHIQNTTASLDIGQPLILGQDANETHMKGKMSRPDFVACKGIVSIVPS